MGEMGEGVNIHVGVDCGIRISLLQLRKFLCSNLGDMAVICAVLCYFLKSNRYGSSHIPSYLAIDYFTHTDAQMLLTTIHPTGTIP